MDGCHIRCAGKPNEILETCPLIQELDLSSNLISRWEDVFQVLQQLSHLSFLNLSHNPLETHLLLNDVSNLPNLQKLIVNNVKLEYNTVCKLLALFPSINELHLSLNDFQDVPDITEPHENVTSLYFVKNGISTWSEVEKLGVHFPNLKCLIVAENPIREIPVDSNVSNYFPQLEKLSINNTLISDWESLDQLERFPSLRDVRFRELPLWEEHEDENERRQLITARLPKIKILNGSKVDESQRENAERFFIRFYKNRENKPKRYEELVSVHGELADLVDIDFTKRDYARVTLTGDIKQNIPIRLDITQTTEEFKMYIADQFGLSLSKFRLLVRHENVSYMTEMRIKSARLERYGIIDGDEIEIEIDRR